MGFALAMNRVELTQIVDSVPSYLDTLFQPEIGAVLTVDPDDTQTALCFCLPTADGLRVVDLVGGGAAGVAVEWGTVTGALSWLRTASEQIPAGLPRPTLVVEAQTGTGAHGESVEGCRRARWHWDAAAELLGWTRVHVLPSVWQSSFVPEGSPWRTQAGEGAGSIKRAYQIRAHAIDTRATNEDRCAALGLAWWYASTLGVSLLGDLERTSCIDRRR